MKKRYLFVTIYLTLTLTVALGQDLGWAISQSGQHSEGTKIRFDQEGNIYLAGLFKTWSDLGGIEVTGNNSGPLFFSKYDSQGGLIIGASLTSLGNQEVFFRDFNVSKYNHMAVSGLGSSLADLDLDPVQEQYVSEDFLSYYNSDFSLKWYKQIQNVTSIGFDGMGNLIVSGAFDGTVDFGDGDVTSMGNDMFLASYDTLGNLLWFKDFVGISGSQSFNEMQIDTVSQSIYVTGTLGGVVDMDPSATVVELDNNDGNSFLAEYDLSGNLVWANQTNIGVGNMDVNGQGEFSFTGNWTGGNIYFARYDNQGDSVWVKIVGSNQFDGGTGVSSDANGNIYLTGYFGGNQGFFDPNNPTEVTFTNHGQLDAYLAKYDEEGNLVWAYSLGANQGDDRGMDIVYRDGSVFLTGYFTNTTDFNVKSGTDALTAQNNSIRNGFLAKYEECLPFDAQSIIGSVHVCQGEEGVVFSVVEIPNATSYNWSLPQGATITSGAGTSSIMVDFSLTASSGDIEVAGVNACGESDGSTTFGVSVHAAIEAGDIFGPPPVEWQTQTYSVPSQSLNYNWTVTNGNIISGQGTNVAEIQWGSNQNSYSIELEVSSNFCSDTAVYPPPIVTSINPNPNNSAFQLFPNPTSGLFELVLPTLIADGEYLVFDNLGKLVQKGSVTTERTLIDIAEFVEGVYTLRVLDTDKPVTTKRIVLTVN